LKLADEVFSNMWPLAETAVTRKLPQRTRIGSGCYRRAKEGAARASACQADRAVLLPPSVVVEANLKTSKSL